MTISNLHKDIVDYIIKDITMTCRRLGIDTVFYINNNDNCDEDLLSTSFQTIPVLFKEIHIKGYIYLEEDNDYVKMTVRLNYKYKMFNGGSNGHSLGTVTYVIDKSYTEDDIRDISMYIDKVKSISI